MSSTFDVLEVYKAWEKPNILEVKGLNPCKGKCGIW